MGPLEKHQIGSVTSFAQKSLLSEFLFWYGFSFSNLTQSGTAFSGISQELFETDNSFLYLRIGNGRLYLDRIQIIDSKYKQKLSCCQLAPLIAPLKETIF